MSNSMTKALKVGVEFEGAEIIVDMSPKYQASLVRDTEHEFTSSVDIPYSTSCTEGAKGGVGLWQFVVTNSDGSVMT